MPRTKKSIQESDVEDIHLKEEEKKRQYLVKLVTPRAIIYEISEGNYSFIKKPENCTVQTGDMIEL